jgi:hypothetical protein
MAEEKGISLDTNELMAELALLKAMFELYFR